MTSFLVPRRQSPSKEEPTLKGKFSCRKTSLLEDQSISLTLKVPITTAADDIHKYFFIVFQRK